MFEDCLSVKSFTACLADYRDIVYLNTLQRVVEWFRSRHRSKEALRKKGLSFPRGVLQSRTVRKTSDRQVRMRCSIENEPPAGARKERAVRSSLSNLKCSSSTTQTNAKDLKVVRVRTLNAMPTQGRNLKPSRLAYVVLLERGGISLPKR